MSNVRVAVGKKPGWEANKTSATDAGPMDEDTSDDEAKEAPLKSIADSLVLLQSLRQSRARWLHHPPFAKFSSRSRGKDKVEITQPPHTLVFLGRCDLEIGPHIFLDTKIIEVNYDQTPPGLAQPPGPNTVRATTSTDVLLEFRENPTERFILPLEYSIIERVLRLGVPPTILLSTVIPAISPEKAPQSAAQHPFTIRFVHAGTPLWEAMQKRVILSNMTIQAVQEMLKKAVDAPVNRSYIPHRLPDGPDFERIKAAIADPFEAKPMALKALRMRPPTPEIPKKRKAPHHHHNPTPQTAPKPPAPKYVTSSGRQITAPVRELPDSLDPTEAGARKATSRVKTACGTCGKSINRKAEDVVKEGFAPRCRDCATAAREAERAAMAKAKPKPNPSLPPQPVMSPYMPRPMGAVGWSPMTTSAGVSPSSFNLFSPRPPPAPGSYSPYKSTPIPGAPGAIKYSPMTPSGSATGSPATTNPYAYPYRPYTTTAPTLGASLPATNAPSSGTSSPFPAPPGPPAHKYTGRYYGVSTADGQTFRPPIYSTTGGPSPYSLNPTVRPPGVASGTATGSPGLGAIGSPGLGGTGAVVRPTTSYPLTTLPPLPRVPPTPAGVKPIPVPVPAMGGDQSAGRTLPPKLAGSGTVADVAKASAPATANPTPSPASSTPPAKK